MSALAAEVEASETEQQDYDGFQLSLKNFSGPFDLLLSLIAKKQMDVTEVALAEVTDEFLAHVRTLEDDEMVLDQSTSFIVVAATLLDLKTARLLPAGFSDPEEELALLEERDLLFARLLQYKAYKDAAGIIRDKISAQSQLVPRDVGAEPQHRHLLPPLVWNLTATDFAALAADVLARTPELEPDDVKIDHLHTPVISVREQIDVMSARLAKSGVLSFSQLVADAETTMMVVVRFMGVLMMFRDRMIEVEQEVPLGEITVIWQPAGAL